MRGNFVGRRQVSAFPKFLVFLMRNGVLEDVEGREISFCDYLVPIYQRELIAFSKQFHLSEEKAKDFEGFVKSYRAYTDRGYYYLAPTTTAFSTQPMMREMMYLEQGQTDVQQATHIFTQFNRNFEASLHRHLQNFLDMRS